MADFSSLTSLDPLRVPLPNGTEVSTCVDRVFGHRHVPQGSTGRVVASDGEDFAVVIEGVGTVRYRRTELVPRKLGQLRNAQRHEAAWGALAACVVLEAQVGSRAWGLDDETSDADMRGTFVLPFPWTAGLLTPPQELVGVGGSSTYWELAKALRHGLRADPNVLEMLYAPSVRARDPIGQWLLEARDSFVSAEIYGSFGRYALSQLSKLERAQRLAEHRGAILSWLRVEPELALDEVVRRLAQLGRAQCESDEDAAVQAREYVKQLCWSLYDLGLIVARDLFALAELAGRADAAELPNELPPKSAYSMIRLIGAATAWLRDGQPSLVPAGAMRDTLLAIKQGQVPLAEVVRLAHDMTAELEHAHQHTPLPEKGDIRRAEGVLHQAREEAARRWITQEPGPLGREAPPRPAARWTD
jgi:hypothetical protein